VPEPDATGQDDAVPQVRDAPERWDTVDSRSRFRGGVFEVRTDQVRMPGAGGAWETVTRDVVAHPGAVAVLLLDDADRVLMIRQYRHPVGRLLWELPAGLRDVDGEPLHVAAARELAEEAGYRAGRWYSLVDLFTSPGMSDERMRVFLAREPERIPDAERTFEPVHEEADMAIAWVPLDDAVAKVFAASIHNQQAAMGILAAYAARVEGFDRLRPADAHEE